MTIWSLVLHACHLCEFTLRIAAASNRHLNDPLQRSLASRMKNQTILTILGPRIIKIHSRKGQILPILILAIFTSFCAWLLMRKGSRTDRSATCCNYVIVHKIQKGINLDNCDLLEMENEIQK